MPGDKKTTALNRIERRINDKATTQTGCQKSTEGNA